MIETLIAAGANPKARFRIDSTPLHRAAMYNENPAVIAALIAAGADLEARDKNDNTPLHEATAFNWNAAMTEALIEAGANLEALNDDGDTPLALATEINGNPAVRKILLAAGAGQIERQRAAAQARRKAQSGPGLFDVAVGVLGGTAIAAAGGGTEEAMEAGAVFAEGVIGGQQPVGNEDFNSGAAPSQAQGGQGQATAGGALNAEDFSTGGVIVSNCAREGTRACIKNRNSQPAFVRFCTPDVDGQYKPALCVSVTVRANGGFVYQGSVDHVAEIYWRKLALWTTPRDQRSKPVTLTYLEKALAAGSWLR